MRILIVDDDPALLRTMERALKAYGLDVVTAEDGESASVILGEHRFDAILSDWEFPKGGGQRMLDSVVFYGVPVIIYSGSEGIPHQHVLTKPASIEAILDKLYQITARSRESVPSSVA